MCFYEFFKVFGYFLEIKCDDAGIINYYLLFIYYISFSLIHEHFDFWAIRVN